MSEILRLDLKRLHIISFQCSKQSKAEGIKKRWESAEKNQQKNENVQICLLLDEIGLAEQSQYRPLKVLHQLLENERIDASQLSFVGLSNWSLDAAKMNRVNLHMCPILTVEDLRLTAREMLKQVLFLQKHTQSHTQNIKKSKKTLAFY